MKRDRSGLSAGEDAGFDMRVASHIPLEAIAAE